MWGWMSSGRWSEKVNITKIYYIKISKTQPGSGACL